MIVVKLKGGLGNQMFQYAFGKALSLQLHQEMALDLSFFERYASTPDITPRVYELGAFEISELQVNHKAQFGLGSGLPYRLNKLADPLMKKLRKEIILTDINAGTDLTGKTTIILDGYFQKEHYFNKESAAIRRAFMFKAVPDEYNAGLLEKIAGSTSVSIHVRRGDYVNNPTTHRYHGVCSPEYYHNAIVQMSKSLTDPHFFIFSDDIAWCRANIQVPGEITFVSHNTGTNSYKDMQLMSACRHHIIANSSFSWWGAWLGSPTNEHTVIAPKKWLAEGSIDTQDLYPQHWLKL